MSVLEAPAGGGFYADVWARTAPLQDAIVAHPFNQALAAGTLDQDRFACYLVQDARYLVGFAKALAAAASRLPDLADAAFFARSAQTALVVERSLHGGYLDEFGLSAAQAAAIDTSPSCQAYTSYLHSVALTEPHEVLVASLLPCLWVYQHVGATVRDKTGERADHPYARWIATYADAGFAESVRRARDVADRLAAGADPGRRDRMAAVFARGCEYEWLFWESAWRLETWPTRRWLRRPD